MPGTVIAYDRELPEIPGRRPWEKPDAYLEKDEDAPGDWRINDTGRRPSNLLLIKKLRAAVDRWREDGYPGASAVTQRLFAYWFDEDHEVSGFPAPFRYYFCQREAIETLVYLVEIAGLYDTRALMNAYAEIYATDLFSKSIEYITTIDGQRRIRRYVPELNATGEQDLPPENLRRYAFKMATGSGKTWVMAMVVVWAHFHKKRVSGSDLSANFLIVAPNVIVYQRLEKDFTSNRIFHRLPLIPPEWKGSWSQKVILRGESAEPDPSGTLFLNNIHQVYESRDQDWTPDNAIDALLGRKPVKDLAASQRSMLERLKDLPDLIVMNDEAHHVHDEDLEWSRSLLGIHRALTRGLSLWLDFSATPKDQNGMYFPWSVVDYPLAQAVEDRIVKAPLIVTKQDDPLQPTQDPEDVTKDNVTEKYGYWIRAAVARWKTHYEAYSMLGVRPVLFIMAEKNVYADVIGRYLRETEEFGFKNHEVLVIHTDTAGEVTKKDLDVARKAARDIDTPRSRYKAIVSVMMLREGWDVHNVSVVLGLRPFTAKAEILPEQVIGRGLRLMQDIGPDTQTLEVLGTRRLLETLRDQLETEGVGVGTASEGPPQPVQIYPIQDRIEYDIAIPITKPRLSHNVRKLSNLDSATLEPIYEREELQEEFRIRLKMEFATTETEVHQEDVGAGMAPMTQDLLGSITRKVIRQAGLANVFADLYPVVRTYVRTRCFGQDIDLEDGSIRSYLHRLEIQEGVAKYLARKIGELTLEHRTLEFEHAHFRLSETKRFTWRRNLPPLEARRTVFNFVATYNDFERRFAGFLDIAPDVLRFASLGATEQGDSSSRFRVDYLKTSGAIGFYHPDFVAVQSTDQGEVHWIIETKGRVWEGTEVKDRAMEDWCCRVTERTGQKWKYARVNQGDFEAQKPANLADVEEMKPCQKDMLAE